MFRFGINPYFENRELFKQFKYNKDTGDLIVDQTEIKWKPGKNLCDPKDVSELLAGKQVRQGGRSHACSPSCCQAGARNSRLCALSAHTLAVLPRHVRAGGAGTHGKCVVGPTHWGPCRRG